MFEVRFENFLKKCGGTDTLIQLREGLMDVVCCIDDVVELEAKMKTTNVSNKEIKEKVFKMILSIEQNLE